MKLASLRLSWFRGAAEEAELKTESRSVVVYGPNGAGKSSFVDAIEYLLADGRVSHLSHEYSGRRLERSIPNTHRPGSASTSCSLLLEDNRSLSVLLSATGAAKFQGDVSEVRKDWSHQRSVLRQDQLSQFISGTKLDKYSVLLPLLGLQHLETAAENLRQIGRRVAPTALLGTLRADLAQIASKLTSLVGDTSDESILSQLEALAARHIGADTQPTTEARRNAVAQALRTKLGSLDDSQKRDQALGAIAGSAFPEALRILTEAEGALAAASAPLVGERILILRESSKIANAPEDGTFLCPACGKAVDKTGFGEHVRRELDRLEAIATLVEARKSALRAFARAVESLRENLLSTPLATWRAEDAGVERARGLLRVTNTEDLREQCPPSTRTQLAQDLPSLLKAAKDDGKETSPGAKALLADSQLCNAIGLVLERQAKSAELEQRTELARVLKVAESSIRGSVTRQAETVIRSISKNVGDLWALLYPTVPIDGIRLYVPTDEEKAIDVGLRFHGKDQDSPRLTLSEGYRNALGLCIFFAMALVDSSDASPIVLDDVVSSFDREHRGMVVQLLEAKFAGRQVLLLTHDREWFASLRLQLDANKWRCLRLAPFRSPEVGISWADSAGTFAEAREFLPTRPDTAAGDARTLMDLTLSKIAESLRLKLPHVRGERNDRRTAHEFLEVLASEAPKRIQVEAGPGLPAPADVQQKLVEADRLLMSWGNLGAHSDDVVRVEATQLIDACEAALSALHCPRCKNGMWFAEQDSGRRRQCGCGALRWKL